MENIKLPDQWDEETDVIVIGSGFAGLAAAIEAKNTGSSVIILEKMKGYGGNSTISDGMMAAPGTDFQNRAGIQDSPRRLYEDMLKAGLNLNHKDLVRTLVDNAIDIFNWTTDYLGVEFREQVVLMGGHSVARSHITHNHSGSAIIKKQLEKIESLGMRVRTRAYLEHFIQDPEGRVCGVAIREGYQFPDSSSGVRKLIKSGKGVILAAGGFANDIPFRTVHDPRLTEDVGHTNKSATTAEALKEALKIGAMPVHLSWIQLGPWASPDEKHDGSASDFSDMIVFPYGIMVDPKTGKRFVNELADRKVMSDAILDLGYPAIGIADVKGIEVSGYNIDHCIKKGIVKAFTQIDEMAEYYKIPLLQLKESISTYNKSVADKSDSELGRPIADDACPMNHSPFYSIRLWPKIHHTMGGVLINTDAQVLDLEKNPIRGLYAAGEITGGIHGACRLGSCAITDCLVFGRIAGRNAAMEEV
ncbi:MAG: flavocytochrome c [Desulfobacterales bacterium]|nr:flavocytochrome c [Desulfobacterales bacterium]